MIVVREVVDDLFRPSIAGLSRQRQFIDDPEMAGAASAAVP